MKVITFFAICTLGWSGVLTVNVPVPEYEFVDGQLAVRDAAYFNTMGSPNVPSKTVTIALPPGAIVQTVDFRGQRQEIGNAIITAAQPPISLMKDEVSIELQQRFQNARTEYYRSEDIYPRNHGTVVAKGGLRKYTLARCYFTGVTRRLKG